MLITPKTARAMQMAEHFHTNQTDQSGVPAMLHVYRVAEAMETENETIVALLHDAIEDTEAMLADFEEFGADICKAIDLVSRNRKDTYLDYIKHLKTNEMARKVKIADIMDHLSLDRAEYLTRSLEERYRSALSVLLGNETENRCSKCRRYMPANGLKLACSLHDEAEKRDGADCVQFVSRFIQYPITVTAIDNKSDRHFSLYPCGQPVIVRPCGDNPEKKTFFGILLGDLPYMATCAYDRGTGTMTIQSMDNPAIYVPALQKVVYGYESWWQRIESPEEAEKGITQDAIDNTWWVKLLRDSLKN